MNIKEHQILLNKYKLENKQTKHEVLFESILKSFDVKYCVQKGFLAKCHTCFIVDFYLPRPHKTIIEIDGGYHKNRNDAGRDLFFLKERKIKTVRFTNEQVENTAYVYGVLNTLLKRK